jgi:hypothetical protein
MTIQEVACVQSAEDTPGDIAYYRRRENRVKAANVRFWPKADIGYCTAHVRFRGKADMTIALQTVCF